MLCTAGRTIALLTGSFALVHLAAAAATGFNAAKWWFDARPLPGFLTAPALALAAVLLMAFGLRPEAGARQRALTVGALTVLIVITLWNSATFYRLAARGDLVAHAPVPFSLLLASAFAVVLVAVLRPPAPPRWPVVAVTAVVCLAGFPLAQIALFGRTDYRRPADAIVVFGARAYANGRCSDALADRVRTACELHREGRAPLLVFSGGAGDGTVDEPEAMRRLAIGLGVPENAILLDHEGHTTLATVRNTAPMLRSRRVLAVSHFYHLPRIKLAFQREGIDVCTVPARERYLLTKMPWFVAREVASLWVCYLRSLGPGQRDTISK